MAQIIPFPGTAHAVAPATIAAAMSHANEGGAPASPDFPIVRAIRKGRRIPKKPRDEDMQTATYARIAASYARRAEALALTDFDSREHRMALHMMGIDHKLPRNNLRVFSTPDDVVTGLWAMWRKMTISYLEWQLAEERRLDAIYSGDADGKLEWTKKLENADAARWIMFERLIRIPADTLDRHRTYKLDRRFGVMANMQFLRTQKPDLAAVLDDELERLNHAKLERKAKRNSRAKLEAE